MIHRRQNDPNCVMSGVKLYSLALYRLVRNQNCEFGIHLIDAADIIGECLN